MRKIVLKIFRLWMAFEKKHFDSVNWASRWLQTEFHFSKYFIEEILLIVIACLEIGREILLGTFVQHLPWLLLGVFGLIVLAWLAGRYDDKFERGETVIPEHDEVLNLRLAHLFLIELLLCLSVLWLEVSTLSMLIIMIVVYCWLCVRDGDNIDKGDRRHLFSFLFA